MVYGSGSELFKDSSALSVICYGSCHRVEICDDLTEHCKNLLRRRFGFKPHLIRWKYIKKEQDLKRMTSELWEPI